MVERVNDTPQPHRKRVLHGLLALCSILLIASTGVVYGQAWDRYRDHAGVVVQWGDGSTATACVSLREKGQSFESTAEELLRDSPFDEDIVVEMGQGTSVCQIDTEGCNTDADEGAVSPCTCQYDPAIQGDLWNYYEQTESGWQKELFDSSIVQPGEVAGWLWGNRNTRMGEVIPFEEICAEPTATATATATSTPTPSDTPTATDEPTPTDEPTAEPTDEPTEEPTSDDVAASDDTSDDAPAPVSDFQSEAPAPRQEASEATPTRSPTLAPSQTTRPTRERTRRPTDTPTLSRTPYRTRTPVPTDTLVPTDTPVPTDTAAPTPTPVPTNTLVPTSTPAPTLPPPPTLPPLPTATPTTPVPSATPTLTPTPSPTPDETATIEAILLTEVALVPTATGERVAAAAPGGSDTVFATPTLNQRAETLLREAQAAPQAITTTETALAVGSEDTIDSAQLAAAVQPPVDTEPPSAMPDASRGVWNYLLYGGLVLIFIVMLIVLQVRQQRETD